MSLRVDKIAAFEQGEANQYDILDLFAELIRTGLAWQLQGTYGRQANSFIRQGLITPEGVITEKGEEWANE